MKEFSVVESLGVTLTVTTRTTDADIESNTSMVVLTKYRALLNPEGRVVFVTLDIDFSRKTNFELLVGS
jgi:hypothetical protein